MDGVTPPKAILGRSLLYVQSQRVADACTASMRSKNAAPAQRLRPSTAYPKRLSAMLGSLPMPSRRQRPSRPPSKRVWQPVPHRRGGRVAPSNGAVYGSPGGDQRRSGPSPIRTKIWCVAGGRSNADASGCEAVPVGMLSSAGQIAGGIMWSIPSAVQPAAARRRRGARCAGSRPRWRRVCRARHLRRAR